MSKQNPNQKSILAGWGRQSLDTDERVTAFLEDNAPYLTIAELLETGAYKKRVKQIGGSAVRSCLVGYRDLSLSEVTRLQKAEPYNLVSRLGTDKAAVDSDYHNLMTVRNPNSGESEVRSDIAILVYPQANATLNVQGRRIITPDKLDLELLSDLHEHSPGCSLVLVNQEDVYTYMTICRLQDQNKMRTMTELLGGAACQEATWQFLFGTGIDVTNINLNGNDRNYKRQVDTAVVALSRHKI